MAGISGVRAGLLTYPVAAPDLVYDLGVCNGDDSAYYLHKGHRVVGVEANPLLVPTLRDRFAAEIVAGRYRLVAAGIAEKDGEADFWVCDDHPEWSSFDRSIASRNGSRHHVVKVPTLRFSRLLESFGPALYCKIDIEGKDDICLQELTSATRPPFLSVEMLDGSWQVRRLTELGYRRFKVISQRTLRPPGPAITALKLELPAGARRWVASAHSRLTRRRSDGSWRFPRGCSGPFGEDTSGDWIDADTALDLIRMVSPLEANLSEWHDIHAAL